VIRLFQAMAGARHGGAEAFFTRLAIGLQKAGQVQRVAIRRDPERAAALRAASVPVAELSFGGRLDLFTRPRLARLIADFRPDVVLSWMNRATAALPKGGFVHAARLGGYYDLKYYRRCDHLVGNTRDIVAYLVRSGWPADRAHYLPNFVDAARLPPVSRATLDTPEDAPLLLALGRLHPNKGFDVLLHALAEIPAAHLWIAGEGAEEASLRQLAARLGVGDRTHFLGWREDAPALMAAADLVVVASHREPLGNVVIEAWAQGVPVVACASEGPGALIRHGETGLLAPVDDAPALAAQIRAALSGDRAALAEAGRAAYEREFTETAVVAAYRDFFERIRR
jgi:glycosyltransferase involved in cell wall biosynthesis